MKYKGRSNKSPKISLQFIEARNHEYRSNLEIILDLYYNLFLFIVTYKYFPYKIIIIPYKHYKSF